MLGDRLIGFYLDGSLTSGDFDLASDIDFLAVTASEITPDLFPALQAMHNRIAENHPRWGVELEGSYLSRAAVRRYDPALAMHPNLERGKKEQLKMVRHDEDWIVHFHVVRERGIPLFGPDPKTLIDPVPPDALRQAMRSTLEKWWRELPRRSCPVETARVSIVCRPDDVPDRLHSSRRARSPRRPMRRTGGRNTSIAHWAPLIDRAWAGRSHPNPETAAEEIAETQNLIRYVLERSRQSSTGR